MSEPDNYFPKVCKIIREGQFRPGSVNQVIVAHDDWCGVFQGERCDCDPQVTVRRPEAN